MKTTKTKTDRNEDRYSPAYVARERTALLNAFTQPLADLADRLVAKRSK